jgi:hypothetical protein
MNSRLHLCLLNKCTVFSAHVAQATCNHENLNAEIDLRETARRQNCLARNIAGALNHSQEIRPPAEAPVERRSRSTFKATSETLAGRYRNTASRR